MAGVSSCGRLFISYSRRNALAQAGIDIWIDREEIDPLDDFPARIRDGLARSHAFLAWYSPEYVQSSYCQKELTAAWIRRGLLPGGASRLAGGVPLGFDRPRGGDLPDGLAFRCPLRSPR